MRICVDIQAAVTQRAGVGRYTQSLVTHLGPLAGEDELVLFYFDFQRRGVTFATPHAVQRAIRWCPGRVVQRAWRTLRWPPFDWFAGPADLYHFPNFTIPPVRGGRHVVTMHDMSFLRWPQFAERRNLRYLSATVHRTVAAADAILTLSRFSAGEIHELLGVPLDRIFPVYMGVPEGWGPADRAALAAFRRRHGLDRPYLLTVSTLEPRKNIPLLVDMFERLEAFDGDLVIAGMRGWQAEPILARMKTSPRADRIRYLDYVADEELPLLYSGAELFLIASHYEGFGMPPVEAMACNTPVVSSLGGALPEVLGDAAVLVEDFDPDRWAHTVASLLGDPDRRRALAAAGRRRAAAYTWTETARQTWDVYRKVLA
jgi:glycosyltransferase involved in cell wall biosynthesis